MLTKNWRSAVLAALFLGPIAIYICLGSLWLRERGWWTLILASIAWAATGVIFAALGARWTKSKDAFLPPIDWDEPETFAPRDRAARDIVRDEADRGESLPAEELANFDLYVETGRRLARRLAAHYNPNATDPIEDVPVAELLTALELAAEDLGQFCRQIPGGDLLTLAHLRHAVQVAGYLQKANDVYSYLLPIFQPWTGLPRLAAQKFVTAPAWRDVRQNLLRWFYAAYVNRLGSHLVELYGGRLVVGAEAYRRFRKNADDDVNRAAKSEGPLEPPVIAVATAKGLERSTWIDLFKKRISADDPDKTIRRASRARWLEISPFEPLDLDSRSARSARAKAVSATLFSDLLILLIDAARDDLGGDRRFLELWRESYRLQAGLERPPLVVLAIETVENAPISKPRLERIRADLSIASNEPLLLLSQSNPRADADAVASTIASVWPTVERARLVRDFHELTQRSKAGRLLKQVRSQGKKLWNGWRETLVDVGDKRIK